MRSLQYLPVCTLSVCQYVVCVSDSTLTCAQSSAPACTVEHVQMTDTRGLCQLGSMPKRGALVWLTTLGTHHKQTLTLWPGV